MLTAIIITALLAFFIWRFVKKERNKDEGLMGNPIAPEQDSLSSVKGLTSSASVLNIEADQSYAQEGNFLNNSNPNLFQGTNPYQNKQNPYPKQQHVRVQAPRPRANVSYSGEKVYIRANEAAKGAIVTNATRQQNLRAQALNNRNANPERREKAPYANQASPALDGFNASANYAANSLNANYSAQIKNGHRPFAQARVNYSDADQANHSRPHGSQGFPTQHPSSPTAPRSPATSTIARNSVSNSTSTPSVVSKNSQVARETSSQASYQQSNYSEAAQRAYQEAQLAKEAKKHREVEAQRQAQLHVQRQATASMHENIEESIHKERVQHQQSSTLSQAERTKALRSTQFQGQGVSQGATQYASQGASQGISKGIRQESALPNSSPLSGSKGNNSLVTDREEASASRSNPYRHDSVASSNQKETVNGAPKAFGALSSKSPLPIGSSFMTVAKEVNASIEMDYRQTRTMGNQGKENSATPQVGEEEFLRQQTFGHQQTHPSDRIDDVLEKLKAEQEAKKQRNAENRVLSLDEEREVALQAQQAREVARKAQEAKEVEKASRDSRAEELDKNTHASATIAKNLPKGSAIIPDVNDLPDEDIPLIDTDSSKIVTEFGLVTIDPGKSVSVMIKQLTSQKANYQKKLQALSNSLGQSSNLKFTQNYYHDLKRALSYLELYLETHGDIVPQPAVAKNKVASSPASSLFNAHKPSQQTLEAMREQFQPLSKASSSQEALSQRATERKEATSFSQKAYNSQRGLSAQAFSNSPSPSIGNASEKSASVENVKELSKEAQLNKQSQLNQQAKLSKESLGKAQSETLAKEGRSTVNKTSATSSSSTLSNPPAIPSSDNPASPTTSISGVEGKAKALYPEGGDSRISTTELNFAEVDENALASAFTQASLEQQKAQQRPPATVVSYFEEAKASIFAPKLNFFQQRYDSLENNLKIATKVSRQLLFKYEEPCYAIIFANPRPIEFYRVTELIHLLGFLPSTRRLCYYSNSGNSQEPLVDFYTCYGEFTERATSLGQEKGCPYVIAFLRASYFENPLVVKDTQDLLSRMQNILKTKLYCQGEEIAPLLLQSDNSPEFKDFLDWCYS